MPISSPSVLIIRLDAIGDALALTPLVQALAAKGIPTDIVLRDMNRGVFAQSAARNIFVAPFELRSSTNENLAAIATFGTRLRANVYSHVLVATEDPGGYRLAKAVGAPNRIGFHNGFGKPFKTLWVRSILTRAIARSAGLDRRAPHEAEVLFALGAPLLGDATPSKDASLLRPFVIEREPVHRDSIVVQVTDKWDRLGIAFDDVVELIRTLSKTHGLRTIASQSESGYAARIAAATGCQIEYFDSLEPWKDAIAGASALVAPDSGALHVAGMTGTPTVAVFPPSAEFELQAARWYPWAAPHVVVMTDDGWVERSGAALGTLL
jgi:ADP-heptose:LPS heptosyltransferase